jgi:hypothetical protein
VMMIVHLLGGSGCQSSNNGKCILHIRISRASVWGELEEELLMDKLCSQSS